MEAESYKIVDPLYNWEVILDTLLSSTLPGSLDLYWSENMSLTGSKWFLF